MSEGEPEEAGDDTGCDEGPKAEEEDTESDGDAEAKVSGPSGVGDSHDCCCYWWFFLEKVDLGCLKRNLTSKFSRNEDVKKEEEKKRRKFTG